MSEKSKIGLIGAGLMGKPMGLNWLKKGFPLMVLPHQSKGPVDELKTHGALVAKNLGELCEFSDFIILMLPTSREVESVVDQLKKYLKKDTIVIDMTTSDPESTRKIFSEMSKAGFKFFDSPVTGGVKGAVEGTLTLFIGGPKEYIEKSKEVLSAISRVQTYFGPAGQGHVAKIINNFVCIANLAVFSEALPLAAKLGLDTRSILSTLCTGTGQSKMLDLYGEQIVSGDFAPRFKLAHAFKDLGLAMDIVKKNGYRLPVLEATFEDFDDAMKSDLGEQNVASLIQIFERKLDAEFRA